MTLMSVIHRRIRTQKSTIRTSLPFCEGPSRLSNIVVIVLGLEVEMFFSCHHMHMRSFDQLIADVVSEVCARNVLKKLVIPSFHLAFGMAHLKNDVSVK